jgi:hypothetical protein
MTNLAPTALAHVMADWGGFPLVFCSGARLCARPTKKMSSILQRPWPARGRTAVRRNGVTSIPRIPTLISHVLGEGKGVGLTRSAIQVPNGLVAERRAVGEGDASLRERQATLIGGIVEPVREVDQ